MWEGERGLLWTSICAKVCDELDFRRRKAVDGGEAALDVDAEAIGVCVLRGPGVGEGSVMDEE